METESSSKEALREVLKKNYPGTDYRYRPRFYNRIWIRRIIVLIILIILMYVLFVLLSSRGNAVNFQK